MRILAISLVTAVFVATVGLGWLFDYVYSSYFQSNNKQPVTAIAAVEEFANDMKTMLDNSLLTDQELVAFVKQWPQQGSFDLQLVAPSSLPLPPDLQQQLDAGKPLTLASDDDIAIHYKLSNRQQLLVVSSPLLLSKQDSNLNRYIFTSLFYVSLLGLMLLWLYPLIQRLLALRATANAFGQGHLEQRVDVGSISYIRDLETEFNNMAQRINDLVGDVKLLSSAVSHDLRTPLATIRFGIDTIQEEEDPVLRKKFEQRVSDNVDAMIELVEILLNYARLDQSFVSLEKQAIRLNQLIEQTIQVQANDTVQISFEPDSESLELVADKKYLSMLLNNLIKNAVQHCSDKVNIKVKKQQQNMLIQISDNGAGVPEEQRENIIKPFVRGNAEHKGYGVGLAIVNRILQWHKGSLTINSDQELGGAKFTVSLPITE